MLFTAKSQNNFISKSIAELHSNWKSFLDYNLIDRFVPDPKCGAFLHLESITQFYGKLDF